MFITAVCVLFLIKIILFRILQVFLLSKNPYDLGSEIRFRILPKKRALSHVNDDRNVPACSHSHWLLLQPRDKKERPGDRVGETSPPSLHQFFFLSFFPLNAFPSPTTLAVTV